MRRCMRQSVEAAWKYAVFLCSSPVQEYYPTLHKDISSRRFSSSGWCQGFGGIDEVVAILTLLLYPFLLLLLQDNWRLFFRVARKTTLICCVGVPLSSDTPAFIAIF